MEGRRDAVMIWEFEFICHFIDLPRDGESTNIVAAQLPAGQPETNVSSGEPDSVARLVSGSRRATGIGIVLISPHCPLEMGVC